MKDTGDIRIDKLMPRLNQRWPVLPFEKSLSPRVVPYKKLKGVDIRPSGEIPVIDQGESFISGYTNESSNAYSGPLPVIIFGDHTRRFKYVNFSFAVGADGTHLLYPLDGLDPKFFYHYLCALNLESQGYSRHYKFLKTVLIPIPPIGEQQRIVVKLEKLLVEVESSQKRLAKIPALLKRFRQSVLAAACSGRLTADWREQNANSKANENDELPNGWEWKIIADVTSKVSNIRPESEPEKVFHYIDISSIDNITFRITDVKKMNGRQVPSRARRPIKAYDVLFSNVRTYLRNIALVPEPSPADICSTGFTVLRPNSLIEPRYLFYYVLTDNFINSVTPQQTGTHYPATSDRVVMAEKILLPPLTEQKEIVRRVEKLFFLLGKIEAQHQNAKVQVDKLTQSILAKAFRGELVPQDPNDEPAEELLKKGRMSYA